MNQRPTFFSLPTHLVAALAAVLLTATQLGAVDALAQHRSISAHAQVVQLERVVVTGQRTAAAMPVAVIAAACTPTARPAC